MHNNEGSTPASQPGNQLTRIEREHSSGFVPATTPGSPQFSWYEYGGKRVGHQSNKCIIKHPSLLVSAHYGLKHPSLRQEFEIDEDVLIIGDSGGFQNYSMDNVNLDPIEVLRWQENNCNIGMTLDYPPYEFTGAGNRGIASDEVFSTNMERSFGAAKKMLEHRTKTDDFLLYLCVHGNTLKRLDAWWERHATIRDKFEGYALAPANKSDPVAVARELAWLYKQGVKQNVHLLAISGRTVIPLLAYAMQHIRSLTFDSSTHVGALRTRETLLPFMAGSTPIGNKNAGVPDITHLPCRCEVCQQVTPEFLQSHNSENHVVGGALLSLHNLLVIAQYVQFFKGVASRHNILLKMTEKFAGSEAVKAIKYFEHAIKHGTQSADTYYGITETTTPQSSNQRSIFGQY